MPEVISFWTFLDWLFYGLVRYVCLWVPLVQPFSVDRSVPAHWYEYNTWSDWYRHLDDDKRPDEHWCRQWLEMAFGEFARLAIVPANDLAHRLTEGLQKLLGRVKSGYRSFSQWLDRLDDKLGPYLPSFARSVGQGLDVLYGLLPEQIRAKYQSWADLFRGIRESAISAVRGLIDEARAGAKDALNWVRSQGDEVFRFYRETQAWVRRFRSDPYGVLSGYLGTTWSFLVGFALSPLSLVLSLLGADWQSWIVFKNGPMVFLFNLWSRYHDDISVLFADPKGYVYDRLSDALTDRW